MASSTRVSLFVLATLSALYFIGGSFFAYQLSLFLIYAIVAQGLGYMWSRTNILPLGQSFFFGLGAYLCAGTLKNFDAPIVQLLLILVSIFGIGLLGFLITALVFKGRAESGVFFSIITLAITMIAEQIATSASALTGGFNGMSGFSTFLGLDPFGNLYWVVAISCAAICFLLLWFDERPLGLIASAIADNELRLQLFGFPTYLVKAFIFGVVAAISGFAGVLFANYQGIVTPTSIGFLLAAEFVIWTAVGGRFHPLGAIIGTLLVGMLAANVRDQLEVWDIVLALGFILVVVKAPKGIWGTIEHFVRRALLPKVQSINPVSAPNTHHENKNATLQFDRVTSSVGNIRILDSVDFTTDNKGVVFIIGPNGAGKTSVLNTITGNLPIIEGSIQYHEKEIHNRDSHHSLRTGIGRKLQVPAVFMTMSIQDNMKIATLSNRMKWSDYFKKQPLQWETSWYKTLKKLPVFDFLNQPDKISGNLPQGHRQFLEFIMTTISKPRLLLLDEPCAGLSPSETHAMSELITKYAGTFHSLVLVVEHDMSIVENISDQVIVMHQGKVIATGCYEDIKNNPDVTSIYLGAGKA